MARFNKSEVDDIRKLYLAGIKVKSIATKYVRAPLSVVFAAATNRTYYSSEYAKQLERKIPLDEKYCRYLREVKNLPISKIRELEKKKSRRARPLSNELIRLRLSENKPR